MGVHLDLLFSIRLSVRPPEILCVKLLLHPLMDFVQTHTQWPTWHEDDCKHWISHPCPTDFSRFTWSWGFFTWSWQYLLDPDRVKWSWQFYLILTQGSKKTFFKDKSRAYGPWKWTSPDFFQTNPNYYFFTKSPHIKVLLVNKLWFWWARYHLRIVISNPRRNVELNIGRIQCKQSTSFYALRCIN